MKELRFRFRGELYRVNEQGHINANGIGHFSKDWVFLGGSYHHWSNRVIISFRQALENPGLLNHCIGWDRDHGTIRRWGGSYNGNIPKITDAEVVEVAG